MSLKSSHITRMFDYGIDGTLETNVSTLKGVWFIVLEHIPGGTILSLVKELGYINESIAQYFIRQIIHAL